MGSCCESVCVSTWKSRQEPLLFFNQDKDSFAVDFYVDASLKFPQEKETKSRSGFVIPLNGNHFTCLPKRQPLTCQSTEDAKLFGANERIRTLCSIRDLFLETGTDFTKPKVFEDNSNAIVWVSEPKLKMCSIHFDAKLALARECNEDGVFDIAPIVSVTNVADPISVETPLRRGGAGISTWGR
jgi:hypothetical protein